MRMYVLNLPALLGGVFFYLFMTMMFGWLA